MQEPLSNKQKDLDDLTYIISHDLQEPLRMITSYVQLLNKRYGESLDDNAKDYIRFAVDGSNRLKKMMDDLLTYSRIGRPAFKRENLEPNEVFERVKKQIYAKHPGITDKLKFAAEVQIINADRDLLEKLIFNLVDNAVKFNSSNKPEINVGISENNDHWHISVKDNGLGIDKDYHGKIFGIFQKLHNHQEYEGSGIGLAICEKIVNKHNGKIWLDSELSNGSTFHATIKK